MTRDSGWQVVRGILESINEDYLDDCSTNKKASLLKQLGVIVNQDLLDDDDTMHEFLVLIAEAYCTKKSLFESLYEGNSFGQTISKDLLDKVKKWYGDMVCLEMEMNPDRKLYLKAKKDALFQILGYSPFEFNSAYVSMNDIVFRFYGRFKDAQSRFSNIKSAFDFITELIEKRAIELQYPMPPEVNRIIERCSVDFRELTPKELRNMCIEIYNIQPKVLVNLPFKWDEESVIRKERPSAKDCKSYIEKFITEVSNFSGTTQSIEDVISTELGSLYSDENTTTFSIEDSVIEVKTLNVLKKSNFSLVAVGIRYDKMYERKNNKIVVSEDPKNAKPIDQLLPKNSTIKIQTRDLVAYVSISKCVADCPKPPIRSKFLPSLPIVSYISKEETSIPFYRMLLYVCNVPELMERVVSDLTELKEGSLMISEEDLLVLFREKMQTDSQVDSISTAKIIYTVPIEVLKIFDFEKKAEEYFRRVINANGSNTNQTKENFIKLLTDDEKTIAFFTKSEIETLGSLVSATKHVFKDQSVESCNLENVVGVISKMKRQPSINFLLIRITGTLSPTELSRLIYSANEGTTKLIFVATPSLINAAQVSGKNGGIIISESINTDNNIISTAFSRNSILNKIFEISEQKEDSHPEYFEKIINESLKSILEKNKRKTEWMNYESKWRDIREENDILFLINKHNNFYIRDYYLKNSAYIVDPIQNTIHDAIAEFIQTPQDIFVVLECHKISDVDKKTILRNLNRMSKMPSVIFVSDYFHPADEIITIDNVGKNGSFKSTVINCAPTNYGFKSETLERFFRAMCLLVPSSVCKNVPPKKEEDIQKGVRYIIKELKESSMSYLDNESSILLKKNLDLIEKEFICNVLEGANTNSSSRGFHTFESTEFSRGVHINFSNQEKVPLFALCRDIINGELFNDIPFDQFIKEVPICQFLSQSVKVKLYIKHVLNSEIHQQTTKLQTGFLLASVIPNDSTYSLENSNHYYLITKPDAQIQFDQLSVMQLLKQEDVDWNNTGGLEFLIDTEINLMKILETYPFSLKFLLSLPVTTVYNVLNEALTACSSSEYLRNQMEQLDWMMLEQGIVMKEHRAVIHWILAFSSDEQSILTATDISTMIGMKLKLTNVKALQKKVMPVILSLNGNSNILSTDLDLKYNLLTEPYYTYLTNIEGMRFGSETIHFLFNPSSRNSIGERSDCILNLTVMNTLYNFIKEPSTKSLEIDREKEWKTLVEQEEISEMVNALSALSEKAIVALIAKCSRKHQLYILAYILKDHKDIEKIIREVCILVGFDLKYFFLDSVLSFAESINEDSFFSDIEDPVCQQIVKPDSVNFSQISKLYLEYSSIIRKSVVENTNVLSIKELYKLLKTKATPYGCSMLFRDLDYATENRSLYFVSWIIGCYHMNISIEASDRDLLTQLFSIEDVKKTFSTLTSQVSDVAAFFLFPSLLSESTFNEYAATFGIPQIQTSFKTICQVDNDKFPPYSCEFFKRSVPKQFIEYLDEELINWTPVKEAGKGFHELKIDVDGISLEKVKMNLQTIYDAPNAHHNGTIHDPTKEFIINFLLSWFSCSGISHQKVYQWLRIPVVKYEDLTESKFKNFTLYPFPSFISTQIVTRNKNILFGKGKEDIIFTIRQFNRLVPPKNQMDPSLYLVEKCDRFGRFISVPSPLYNLRFTEVFLEELARNTKTALLASLNTKRVEKYFLSSPITIYSLKPLQSQLKPFTRMLQDVISLNTILTPQFDNHNTGYEQVKSLLGFLLNRVNISISTEEERILLQALLFKAFFSLFGIIAGSPESSKIITALLEVYSNLTMEICIKSLDEIKWMNTHKFITIQNLDNYKSGTKIDSEYGDFLIYSKLDTTPDYVIDQTFFPNLNSSVVESSKPHTSNFVIEPHKPSHVFFQINNENRDFLRTMDEQQYTESFLKQYDNTPSCIDVTGFIEIESYSLEGETVYSTVRVVAGNTCSLVTLKNKPYMKVLKERDYIENNEVLRQVATFSSHEFLWNTLQQYPVGSVLFTESGFMMVRIETCWKIYFNLFEQRDDNDIFYPVFRLVFAFKILNYSLDQSVNDFLMVVCRVLSKGYLENIQRLPDQEVITRLCEIETSQEDSDIIEKSKQMQSEIYEFICSLQQNIAFNFNYLSDEQDIKSIREAIKFKLNPQKCERAKEILKGSISLPALSSNFVANSIEIVRKLQNHEDFDMNTRLCDLGVDENRSTQFKCYSLDGRNPKYLIFLNVPFDYPLLRYERKSGVPVGFLVSSSVLAPVTEKAELFLNWLTVLLMSSLTNITKTKLLKYFYHGYISQDLANHLTPNLKVMFYSLGKQCPVASKSSVLMEAVDIPYPEMLTKQSNYSIHFVSCQGTTDTLQQLREMMEIEVLDYTEYYKNGSLSFPQIYLSIIEPFLRRKCGVYVKGLKTIEDSLLKWCAEFTKDVPWAFIYFEEPITSYNLPENLDRCYIHKEYARQVLDNKDKQLRNTFVMTYSRKDKPKLVNNISRFKRDWKQQIKAIAEDPKERWMLIVGPPGIGKSYHFEQKKIVADYYFDGSKDILVRTSLVDILEYNTKTLIKQDTTEFLVVIDEYHMLSDAHKRQLFSWAKKNNLVKLILISNRYDLADRKLLEAHLDGNVDNNMVHCSGIFDEMRQNLCPHEEYVTNGTTDRRLFRALYLWYHSTRNLFGEEMMTYRIFKLVSSCLKDAIDKMEVEKAKDMLSNVLQKKQPSFTKDFCSYYVTVLLDIIYKEEDYLSKCIGTKTFDELDQRLVEHFQKHHSSYMTLLIGTSLLISREQNNLTFPEFSNNIENEYQYHVVSRLVSFIEYMCDLKSIDLTAEEKNNLELILLRCEVIDKPCSFPQLRLSTKFQALTQCEVECVKVDFNNLEFVHNMLIRGYAIDFHQAQKHWKKKPIQNPKQFEKILSAYPPVASFVSEENIYALLKRSPDTSLCRYLLKEDDSMHPKNCFYLSCWKLYKDGLLNTEKQEISRVLEVTKIPDGQILEIDKLELLLWVSKFGRSLLDINGNVKQFESVFVKELYYLTNNVDVRNEEDMRMLCEIWSGLFSGYMNVLLEENLDMISKNTNGIHLKHAMFIARHFYPPLVEWPYIPQILSRLWYCPSESAKELEIIANVEEFWRCLELDEASDLLDCFILSPALTLSMKKRIMQSPFSINLDPELIADVVNSFSEALLLVDVRDIKLRNCEFLLKCKEYITIGINKK